MNVTNAPLQAAPIPTSTPPSRRLSIAFDSQPELAVPLTPVHRLPIASTALYEATEPVAVLHVDATPTPYSHWGINE